MPLHRYVFFCLIDTLENFALKDQIKGMILRFFCLFFGLFVFFSCWINLARHVECYPMQMLSLWNNIFLFTDDLGLFYIISSPSYLLVSQLSICNIQILCWKLINPNLEWNSHSQAISHQNIFVAMDEQNRKGLLVNISNFSWNR